MHDLVQESNLQGMLAWKIAKAYTREKRYDMAAEYYEAAFEGRMPVGETVDPLSTENSLPFYRNALKRHIPDVELLFDAGLAYANASRELGWEESRWRTAVLIFERMLEMKPDDLRSPYQLALLYAFTTKSDLKNTERALGYLERILKSEENNIPARFAMAHIHVMEGHYEKGRSEYVTIKDVIENMFNAGLISGSYQRNPQYQKAVQNIEKLDLCIEGSPQCELMR
jgi:tetratricopeptide (TPR) repeat protein